MFFAISRYCNDNKLGMIGNQKCEQLTIQGWKHIENMIDM